MPRVAKTKAPPGVVKKQKKGNGYAMPESIPLGEILTDLAKKQWKIGPSIGAGGFGEIYSACKEESTKKKNDYNYVVKIEPHGNGPLFVEMHFYMRNAKLEELEKFMKKRNLKALGMPYLIGSGSHDLNGQKHRFIVLPRYGRDIWSFFLENGRKIPDYTIYRLSLQMLDVYEYIHGCTYVHADLKGANILLGYGKNGEAQSYLVDYGLASHYTTKDFKPDPKKMHNGTIEYTSRDAHQGVPTMRGDFEILGYNIIHWSGVTLPWEADKLLSNPSKVQKSKEDFMNNTEAKLNSLFKQRVPEPINQYISYVSTLKYNDIPDYEKCRKIFLAGLKAIGKSNTGNLDFKLKSSVTKSPRKLEKSPLKLVKSPKSPTAIGSKSAQDDKNEADVFETPEPINRRKRNLTPKVTPTKHETKPKASQRETTKTKPSNEEYLGPTTRRNKNTPLSATVNFSPVVSIKQKSSKHQGKTVINDNLTPNSKSSKTYEFNFELDVSMDANVIVNVKRKKKEPSTSVDATPEPKVKVRKIISDASSPSKK